MLRRALLIAILAVAGAAPAGAASKDRDVLACDSLTDMELRVKGCGNLLARKTRWPTNVLFMLHVQRGQGYRNMGQYQRAFDDFSAAIKYNPKSALAYAERGDAYNGLGDFDNALKDSDEAIRLDPKLAGPYAVRGMALLQQARYDDAIEVLSKAIRLDPKLQPPYTNRASAWLAKGEYDRAITDLDSAIKIDPKHFMPFNNRCTVWKQKDELDNALADCDQAIKLNGGFASAFVNRGSVWFEKGELDKALSDFNQAIRIDPSNSGGYSGRGEVWRKKGELDRALADYERAIALNPRSAGPVASKGLVLEAKGDSEGARAAFQAAIDLPAAIAVFGGQGGYTETAGRDQATARARLKALASADSGSTGPLAGPARAPSDGGKQAEPPQLGRRIALVIGNGAYVSANRLANPPNDARIIAKNLRDLGFEVSDGLDLDRAGMTRLIGDFLRAAATADMAVLFYAGHGVQIDGRNYLVPVDAQFDGPQLTAQMTDVDTVLAGLDDRIRTNIVILDACRDNPVAQATQVAEASRSVSIRSGLAAPSGLGKGSTVGAGTLLAFATAPGQVALDGDGENSPFSKALARHIGTPGIEVQQMLTRVRADVVAATRSKQVPWSNSSLLGEVFLAGKP